MRQLVIVVKVAEESSMHWEELPPDVPQVAVATAWLLRAVAGMDLEGGGLVAVLIAEDTLDGLRRTLGGDVKREQLCLLSGRPWRVDEGECLVSVVTGFLHVREAEASATHVGMHASDWPPLLPALPQSDGERLVGWAHSHPGFGAFLSETDLRTQARWFAQPWSVALVFDPVRDELLCFGGAEGKVVPLVARSGGELQQSLR